jgi:ABC-2 type transport system permease protein
VRRELWENRSITLAPAAVAALLLLGFLAAAIRRGNSLGLDALTSGEVVVPYNAVCGMLVVTAFLVGAFYCLDALHGERRDRSVLFWKSMPVSDLVTVLAKASVPLLVLPAVVFPIVVACQLVMLSASAAVLAIGGGSVGDLWARLPLFQSWVAAVYALAVLALWHAPLYAWLLLVSAWARRAPILWAVLPLVAISAVERVAFGASYLGALLAHRLTGWLWLAFAMPAKGSPPPEPLAAMTPLRVLGAPGLWIGLAFAAVFLAAAVRMRRHREPI